MDGSINDNSLPINPAKIIPELIFKAEATTGEGSIWHPDRQTLFWVDIEGKTLYEYLPEEKSCHTWTFDRMVSTAVPETEDTVVVALQDEIIRVHLAKDERESVACIDHKEGTLRCNDGKCDPAGRLWIGTITLNAPDRSAALYTVHSNGTVETKLTGITNSNGIVWSPDEKYMYYIDTPTRQIDRYNYDVETGKIQFDKVVVTVDAATGYPDGMTIDRNGNLWVAQWEGYGVYCYHPETGELIEKIEVPAPNVASCGFGGEDMGTLFITTARAGLTEEELSKYPLSGSLFCCRPGVTGIEAHRFK